MTEHPVKRKLRNDILPYLITARQLRKQWFYRSHIVFGYTTDLLVALSAAGIVLPAWSTILASQSEKPNSGNSAQAITSLPVPLAYPFIILIILWVVWRVAFNREDGQKKAVLAKSCSLAMRQAEAKLPRILNVSNPMPDITKMYEETLMPSVDRGIQEGAWPWTPFAPKIDEEVEKQLAELCRKHESLWAPADSTDLRGVLPEGNAR